jgi:hypothetical protein
MPAREKSYISIFEKNALVTAARDRRAAANALLESLRPKMRQRALQEQLSRTQLVYWSPKREMFWFRYPEDRDGTFINPLRVPPGLRPLIPLREPPTRVLEMKNTSGKPPRWPAKDPVRPPPESRSTGQECVYISVFMHSSVVLAGKAPVEAARALRKLLPPSTRRSFPMPTQLERTALVFRSKARRAFWFQFKGSNWAYRIHPSRIAAELRPLIQEREPKVTLSGANFANEPAEPK